MTTTWTLGNMTDTDEAGGSQSQLGRAHAYLDFLADVRTPLS